MIIWIHIWGSPGPVTTKRLSFLVSKPSFYTHCDQSQFDILMNKSSHHHRLFQKKNKHSKNNTTTWYGRLGTVRYIWPKGDFEIFSLVLASNPTWGGPNRGCQLVEIGVGIGWFVESRTAGLVEETDWFMKYIFYIYMCVCVLTMRYVKVSFCCITLAPFPTSITYHKIDMYRDAKLLPRCKINTTRISTCSYIYIYTYQQHKSLEYSSQFNQSQDIHMQKVNPWTIVPRRVTTSWEPYTHESYNLK